MKNLSNDYFFEFNKKNIRKEERANGVYFFYNYKKDVIYVGKSVSLRDRLTSYLSKNLIGKTKSLVENIKYFKTIKAGSEIEALILEANFIKKYYPKYNVILKDGKSYIYVRITNDKYPRVIPARKKDLKTNDLGNFGPFPTVRNVKLVLKRLRKIVSYSDHLPTKNICFRSQLGLCNPCPSYIESVHNETLKKVLIKDYKRNIKFIKSIFDGKLNDVKKDILNEIRYLSEREEYEKAKVLKDYLNAFEYVERVPVERDKVLETPNFMEDVRRNELKQFKRYLNKFLTVKSLYRIECYDVAHISGNLTTASMIVFLKGIPEKSHYRHFRLKHKEKGSDTASILEVAQRRSKHFLDWGIPDLVLIDGGLGQLNAFKKGLQNESIPVISYAKYSSKLLILRKLYNVNKVEKINISSLNFKNMILNMIDEAHRFTRRYHHLLLTKSYTPK